MHKLHSMGIWCLDVLTNLLVYLTFIHPLVFRHLNMQFSSWPLLKSQTLTRPIERSQTVLLPLSQPPAPSGRAPGVALYSPGTDVAALLQQRAEHEPQAVVDGELVGDGSAEHRLLQPPLERREAGHQEQHDRDAEVGEHHAQPDLAAERTQEREEPCRRPGSCWLMEFFWTTCKSDGLYVRSRKDFVEICHKYDWIAFRVYVANILITIFKMFEMSSIQVTPNIRIQCRR